MSKRTRTVERKKEREQSRQRNQQIYIIVGIVVVAVFAVLIFALNNVPTDVELPSTVSRLDNYLTSTTAEGYPLLGNPAAPVEVREFASFACSGCLTFHETTFPQLLPEIASGKMKFVFVPATTGSVPNPDGANRTALCAGQQGKFWQMHEVLFHWQSIYGNSAFQDQRLRAGIGALGLNEGTFLSCFNSTSINTVLASAQAEGVTTTPTILVNNAPVQTDYASIMTAVNSNVAGVTSFASGLIPNSATEEVAPTATEEVAPTATEETAPEATEAMEESTEAPAEATEASE